MSGCRVRAVYVMLRVSFKSVILVFLYFSRVMLCERNVRNVSERRQSYVRGASE